MPLVDPFNRPITYLRISVTDRCNLRCLYCTSPGGIKQLPRGEVLTYEEITRVVEAAVELGVTGVKLTGGEPTARAQITRLVGMLASLPGISDLSMTTNGLSLKALARELKEAGLKRVNISLDTLRPERFRAITRNGSLRAVLDGIEAALEAGLEPVKLNVVAIKGVNDDELPDLARMSLERNLHIRFIELMPFVDLPYIPSGRVKGLIERALGRLEPAEPPPGSGPARYYRLPGARGTIGFISPLSGEHFCDACNRLRLTAEGRLRPCLLTDIERDIRPALRAGASKEELKRLIRDTVGIKPERHPLGRGVAPGGRRMVEIGG